MSNPEIFQSNPENNIEVKNSASEQLENIKSKYEKNPELSPRDAEAQAERARQEAHKSAVSVEKGSSEIKKQKEHAQNNTYRPINKKVREESYGRTMKNIQAELSFTEQAFSKVIHNKFIEKTSDIAGNTIARPNALLAGAFCAFILTLITYVIAKKIGYSLSGFETILAFIIGWIIGNLYDIFRSIFQSR